MIKEKEETPPALISDLLSHDMLTLFQEREVIAGIKSQLQQKIDESFEHLCVLQEARQQILADLQVFVLFSVQTCISIKIAYLNLNRTPLILNFTSLSYLLGQEHSTGNRCRSVQFNRGVIID